MRDATRLIRATLGEARQGAPLHAGPVFAAPFHVSGEPEGAEYSYARSHNPTWTALEQAIAGLEGEGAAVRVFGSGMAAMAAAFTAVLRAGDVVVMQEGCYFGASNLLTQQFGPIDVQIRKVQASRMATAEAVAGARLVWVETPSNPELELIDIAAVVRVAHAAGALVGVDNTTPTPLGQKPLELGADLSVCSDSKSMCGHSDLLMGHVASKNASLLEAVDRHRTLTGGVAGPMEAWLALRSLATLPLRLERSCANALAISEFLSKRAEVRSVLYPGLARHAGHAIAAAQMTYFGPVLSFTLASRKAAEQFLEGAELVTEATSFGGVTTTAERRARWGHDGVAPGFIRMSAGCEEIEDLLADIGQALDAVR